MDYNIKLYFNAEGEFIQEINGRQLKLHPYAGIQLQAFQEQGRDWKRAEVTKYESTDVMKFIKRQEPLDANRELYNSF